MLSLADTLSFSFCKRSFFLGTILLFIIILSSFGIGETIWYMIQNNIEPTPKDFEKIAVTLYIGQTIGYSILFSYLYIRAKQSIYNLPPRFSSEFFIRVFLTFFCMSIITSLGLYFASPYIKNYTLNSFLPVILSHPNSPKFPWLQLILKTGLPMLSVALIVGYLWSSFYMAYIMHFNFQRFGYKLFQVLKHPLVYLQIVGLGLLFLILTYIPAFVVYWILQEFRNDIASSFILTSAGSGLPIIPLIIFAFIFGIPIVTFCFKTTTGRILTLLFTLLFFIIYGLVRIVIKQIGFHFVMSISIVPIIYLYIFFYLFCIIFVMTSIILPTGMIHLMVQGAFQVHKTFEPSVDKQPQIPNSTLTQLSAEETVLPPENEQNNSKSDNDDGWL